MKNEKIELHYTQQEAIDFLVNSINEDKEVVALIGAGGVGKSEILSVLEENYENSLNENEYGKDIYVSATTNKAVSRLLQVVDNAKTVHSLTARPKYTKLYEELEHFFKKLKLMENKEEFIKSFPFHYSKTFIKQNHINVINYRTINDLLSSLRISPFSKEMFDRYIINDEIYNSVIIIDEASMLPNKSIYIDGSLITIGLDAVKKVFSNIILVGDNSQLPPVNGKSSFDDIENYELTKNFRSEVDLLEAIQYAREGKYFGDFKSNSPNVKIVNSISDKWYDATFNRTDVAHIVYTNKTRHNITKKIRGKRNGTPENGEPILLRGRGSSQISKGEIGVYNNGIIKFEKGEMKFNKYNYFDEYEKDKYGLFQYGYSMTAHMAQGSSFKNVIVHIYDIPSFLTREEKRKWIYTAVSRARTSLTIVL